MGFKEIASSFKKSLGKLNLPNSNANQDILRGAEEGNTDIVEDALSKGANINALWPGDGEKPGLKGMTPLMIAAYNRHSKLALNLLERGCDPNIKSDSGYTALQFAAKYCSVELVQSLLKKDVDLDAVDDTGETALHKAVQNDSEVLKSLIDAGADLNIQDRLNGGWTPLMVAAYLGYYDAVSLLIEAGARLDIRDRDNYNAFLLASDKGEDAIAEMLEEAGEKGSSQRFTNFREHVRYAMEFNGREDDLLRELRPPIKVKKCCASCFFWVYPTAQDQAQLIPNPGKCHAYAKGSQPWSESKKPIIFPTEQAEVMFCDGWVDLELGKLLVQNTHPNSISPQRRQPVLVEVQDGLKHFANFLAKQ